jgi:hypothetical protein
MNSLVATKDSDRGPAYAYGVPHLPMLQQPVRFVASPARIVGAGHSALRKRPCLPQNRLLVPHLCLCLTVFCTQCCPAQEWTKDPTTWWPDPSTGLMWTGQVHAGPSTYPKLAIPSRSMYWTGLNWQQANDYCASLRISDFADWRLQTLDEVKDAIEIIRVNPLPVCLVLMSLYTEAAETKILPPG